MNAKNETAEFWDRQSRAPRPMYWFFYPQVRAHVNALMTGADWGWPQLWLKSQFDLAYEPRRRGVSIGCGVGNLERSLRKLRVCEEIDGFDISSESIRQAREVAAGEGATGLRYEAADCEQLDFADGSIDAVFFSHSLHHIGDPDALLGRVNRWLKPDGFVYIDDYVGPSRDEWQREEFADRELAAARAAMEIVPKEMRADALYPPLDLADPSEMIASDRIMPAIEQHLAIRHHRPYWGNLLFPLLNIVDGNAMSQPQHAPLLERLIALEDDAVARGAFERPLFAFVVARKRC